MSQNSALEKRTLKKVSLRIIPFIFILYIIAFLDRVNIGYAALDMNQELGLTAKTLGFITGIFFLGYFIFEIPSNIFMNKFGARKWIARIMITWGAAVVITAWVQTATQLTILRFLLGVAEAGFAPGVFLYITFWFRPKERARAFALFLVAMAASNIIGAPLSTWIMDNISWVNMAGWRWLFILTGAPAIIAGIVTFFYLTDRPRDAKWLTDEEKEWLISEIEKDNGTDNTNKNHTNLGVVFRNWKIWRLALTYFAWVTGLYGIGLWLPTIIQAFSSELTTTQVGLIATIPYILGGITMILWAFHSDRSGERKMHTAIPKLLGAIGLIGAGVFTSSPIMSMIMVSIATIGLYSFMGPFWSLASATLSASTAVVGIAVINSFGNLGGFLGPYIVGYLRDATGQMENGLYFLGIVLAIGFFLILTIKKKDVNDSIKANPENSVKNNIV
ncbi:MFS transporter [Peribacillus butanolivorans]|uniref:MFS transporter n=1 Tax=Peribacillus butanolivorans TaxID=421767 RepID=UPI0037C764F3